MTTVHTYPVNDIVGHDTEGGDCICGPTVEPVEREDGSVGWHVIHHSLDGREFRETEDVPTVGQVRIDPAGHPWRIEAVHGPEVVLYRVGDGPDPVTTATFWTVSHWPTDGPASEQESDRGD